MGATKILRKILDEQEFSEIFDPYDTFDDIDDKFFNENIIIISWYYGDNNARLINMYNKQDRDNFRTEHTINWFKEKWFHPVFYLYSLPKKQTSL